MRRIALAVLASLALLLTASRLAACGSGGPSTSDWSQPAETVFDESYAFAAGGEVVADLHAADLEVRTSATDGARIRVETRGRQGAEVFERARFVAVLDGGRLVIATDPRPGRGLSGGLTVIVEVPEDVSVNAEVGSGDVTLGPLTGAIAIDTGSGNVEGASVGGAAEVETGSGEIELGPVAGGLDVSTGSGGIEVSVSGPAPVSAEAGSGDVDLALDKDLGFDVAIQTGSGEIEIDDALPFSGRVRDRDADGQIGGGGSPLRVSTGSGDVSIHGR